MQPIASHKSHQLWLMRRGESHRPQQMPLICRGLAKRKNKESLDWGLSITAESIAYCPFYLMYLSKEIHTAVHDKLSARPILRNGNIF
ncbi:hypothetical protein VDIAB_90042 [Vibrio diabolicus]|nr:hypothetical protein VDIAB_90042 [Vibrio diabolicus]